MFTGLIQQIGKLERIIHIQNGLQLAVLTQAPELELIEGQSIAVNGVCLTITSVRRKNLFICDVLQETLATTTFIRKKPGCSLNLELPLQLGAEMGGHIVTGHVDGIGAVLSREKVGRDYIFRFTCPEELIKGIILKGSIAIDGVSLTVTELKKDSFAIHIIPYTLSHTLFCELKRGDEVNIEIDIIGKYVYQYMNAYKPGGKLTITDLHKAGFAE